MEFKDKEQLVQSTIDSIKAKLPDLDFSDGEPLKTIIEAIMNELDLQYWQLEQAYDSAFIDTSYGEDLSNLVKLLGINRLPAVHSYGKVKFYRDTPALNDYTISAGTLVETLPNSYSEIIRYETTESVVLLKGTKEVYASIKSVEPGLKSNVTANKIIIINDPPLGIESVVNEEAVIGGKDEETDDALKVRAKTTLEASGLGTVNAIKYKIENNAGVKSVKVLDMARGIGTMDILVLGEVLPMPIAKLEELNNLVYETKAGGIDFRIIEPEMVMIDVDVVLKVKNNDNPYMLNDVNKAIDDYFKSLSIGDSFIVYQLSSRILQSSDNIIDIISITPNSNVVIDDSSIVILNNKTVSW